MGSFQLTSLGDYWTKCMLGLSNATRWVVCLTQQDVLNIQSKCWFILTIILTGITGSFYLRNRLIFFVIHFFYSKSKKKKVISLDYTCLVNT